MPVDIDLHVHTKFSGDSQISPKIIVEQLHSHPQIKGVAITDHDTMRGFHHVRKLAAAYSDLIVIPSIELTTQQGHMIILGIEKEPKRLLTVWEAVDFGIEQGGVIVIPHPYRHLSGMADVAREVHAHAIEVLNPRVTREANNQASELAKIMGLAPVGGSDCHHIDEMWAVCTEIDAEPRIDDILNAIKMGRTKPKVTTTR